MGEQELKEQISKELQEQQNWFDYYNRFAKVSDPVKPTLKKYVGVQSPDGSVRRMNPNSKDEVRRALDMYPGAMQQVGKNFGSYVDSPAWMANLAAQTPGGQQMMKDFGITQDELPAVLKMRDDFKAQYPQAFQLEAEYKDITPDEQGTGSELLEYDQAELAEEVLRNED